jgi:hypothetical protein
MPLTLFVIVFHMMNSHATKGSHTSCLFAIACEEALKMTNIYCLLFWDMTLCLEADRKEMLLTSCY